MARDHFDLLEITLRDKERADAALAAECETDTLCRQTASRVLGEWVNGDSYGVPSLADIVDELVRRVLAEPPRQR